MVSYEAGEEVERLLGGSAASFGAGERAALAVFYAAGVDVVLTDGHGFLRLLAGADPPVPAVVPAAAAMEDLETMQSSKGGEQ